MFGKYIMKKTQQKRRGGKTQKRRGGNTQKRRGEMKRKVMRGGVVFTKEKENLLTELGGTIDMVTLWPNIFSEYTSHVIIGGKFFYIKNVTYNPETFNPADAQKKIQHYYAVEFDYECINSRTKNVCTFVVYFDNIKNCIQAINEYYGLSPLVTEKEIKWIKNK